MKAVRMIAVDWPCGAQYGIAIRDNNDNLRMVEPEKYGIVKETGGQKWFTTVAESCFLALRLDRATRAMANAAAGQTVGICRSADVLFDGGNGDAPSGSIKVFWPAKTKNDGSRKKFHELVEEVVNYMQFTLQMKVMDNLRDKKETVSIEVPFSKEDTHNSLYGACQSGLCAFVALAISNYGEIGDRYIIVDDETVDLYRYQTLSKNGVFLYEPETKMKAGRYYFGDSDIHIVWLSVPDKNFGRNKLTFHIYFGDETNENTVELRLRNAVADWELTGSLDSALYHLT